MFHLDGEARPAGQGGGVWRAVVPTASDSAEPPRRPAHLTLGLPRGLHLHGT